MSYFDALTGSGFKKDDAGNIVFYPWGVFGKGRVLQDEETENKVREFIRRYYTISLPVIIIVGVTVSWVYALILLPVLFAWYYVKSRALIAGCAVTQDKLTLKQTYTNSAKVYNKKVLWLFLIFSILFGAGGLSMVFFGTSIRDKIISLLTFLFFGACAVNFGYMIKARRT